MKTGLQLIADERAEQIHKHGFDLKHDLQYEDEELILAAESYLMHPFVCSQGGMPGMFPLDKNYWKPKDRISDLAKVGAFCAAQIDVWQTKNGVSPSAEIINECDVTPEKIQSWKEAADKWEKFNKTLAPYLHNLEPYHVDLKTIGKTVMEFLNQL